jgi:predicted DNA-binding transcriptional regulator AlpA
MTATEPVALDPLLPINDLVRTLNGGRRTLERRIAGGEFPMADLRIGKMPRWQQATVAVWIAKGGEG